MSDVTEFRISSTTLGVIGILTKLFYMFKRHFFYYAPYRDIVLKRIKCFSPAGVTGKIFANFGACPSREL